MRFNSVLLQPYTPTFPTTYNNHLTSISQWQYWWWFWFSFLLALYAVFFMRMIFNRTLVSNPKIVTTYRSHGRWGDLLVCLVPIFWCVNILANSHFLLRALEWQTETSFLTLRVRGKQWYWVYKYNVRTYKDVTDLHILIGHNIKKRVDRNFMVNWDATYSRIDDLYKRKDRDAELFDKLELSTSQSLDSSQIVDSWSNVKKFTGLVTLGSFKSLDGVESPALHNATMNLYSAKNQKTGFLYPKNDLKGLYYINNLKNSASFLSLRRDRTLHRWVRDSIPVVNSFDLFKNDLGVLKVNKRLISFNANRGEVAVRNTERNVRSSIKQEKYKVDRMSTKLNERLLSYLPKKSTAAPTDVFFVNKKLNKLGNVINVIASGTAADYNYLMEGLKPNNSRTGKSEVVRSYYHRKRLLWVNRQIVLPAEAPLTIITNSYDVIHSWFIPGLGLKLDCVPGRATHHTIYIERPGYYYGQCAEICGRRHHHMPIKILALPFSHFLYWWNVKLGERLAERHLWILENPYIEE